MGFMDKVKAAAGVGTAKLEVDIKERPTSRGGKLVALARVVPGKTKQKMRYLQVEVHCSGKWTMATPSGHSWAVEGKAFAHKVRPDSSLDVFLEPGQTRDFPIELTIPADGPTSGPDCKWSFFVRADIDEVADPDFETSLDIRG